MITIEKIKIGEVLREVEVDWSLYKGPTVGSNASSSKRAYIDFIAKLKDKDCILKSEYINNRTKVLIDFNCGHKPHKISPYHFKEGKGCTECAKENRKKNNIKRAEKLFLKFCEDNKYTPLTPYLGARTKVLIDFNCGHKPHWITPNNLKRDRICPKCAIENRASSRRAKGEDDLIKYCNEKKYKILSPYKRNNTKVLIDFNCGHEAHWIRPGHIRNDVKCPKCAIENNKGENNPNWKGGKTSLASHLRQTTTRWKYDSFNYYNKTCIITGKKHRSNRVHHLTGFNIILLETMETLKLDIRKQVNMYTPEELKLIEDKCLELHYKYGLGVVLAKEVHDEFHLIYGKGNNTPEQFEEFRQMKLK